ncbi:thiamine diphosphokinase [Mucilaginibacter sp. X4EP1]|uniref:thiamine diphosphokinase n=1 Tax=Mucilaginibacter sp. X4EP1 TaxID=2723092 RepID=UPI0021695ECC|nr:thiamine diphosphokinase [Mucilaginibacter sp. X4EP1]MCS3811851.1 thiamine pyrophosphokinase [Mucilaginibacter sp. X4EP1]
MSSHHVVREKQEPALLVLGMDSFDDEMLGQLLEWSPTVITTQQTAEKLNTYGIKIDWMITSGDDDELQSDIKLMSPGDDNLTDAALKYLIGYEYPAVNIITDKLNLKDYEHFANQIDLVIFHNQHKIYPVNPGFSKWKPAGEIIELLSPVSNLHYAGLEQLKDHQYKTTHDGFFSLHFDEPFVFIAEEI